MNFDLVKESLRAQAERRGLSEYEIYFMESSELSTEALKDETFLKTILYCFLALAKKCCLQSRATPAALSAENCGSAK